MAVSIGDAKFIRGRRIDGNPSDGEVLVFDAGRGVFEWRDFYEVSQNVVIVNMQASAVVSTQPRPENPTNGALIHETDTKKTYIYIDPDWHQLGASRYADSISRANELNIQMLFLQQAKLLDISAGGAVDGFYDALEDTSGIDGFFTTGAYSEAGKYFEGIEGSSSSTATLTVNSDSQFERSDDRGLIRQWYQDDDYCGHFEGVQRQFDAGSVADKGSGKVGFPATNHGLSVGQAVRFYGFTNEGYNSVFSVDSASGPDEIVVVAEYVAESIAANSRFYRVIPTIGAGQQCPDVSVGCFVIVDGQRYQIDWIDGSSYGAGTACVQLSGMVSAGNVDLITGAIVEDGALVLKGAFDPEGSRNTSTTDAVPELSDGTDVSESSYTPSYEGWKIFNNDSGAQKRWLTAAGNTTGWVTYDFGNGNERVINKYRWRTMESDSNAVPGEWQLQGSNDGVSWQTLHSGTNEIETGDTWIGYFEFRNRTAYRYYKFNVTANLGHATYLVVDELELVAAPEATAPVGKHPVILDETHSFNCSQWDSLSGCVVSDSNAEGSTAHYSVTFDWGITWKVFYNGAWREIARQNGGTWQYKNGSDQWTTASVNTAHGALREAGAVATNLMDGSALMDISENNWAIEGGWTTGTSQIGVAILLTGSGQACPAFSEISFGYDIIDTDIDVVSKAYEADEFDQIDRLTASILIKNKTEYTKVYASSGESIEWTELTPLSRAAELANGVEFYTVTTDSYEADGFDMRLRVYSPVGYGTELHGFALSWG